MFDLVAQENHIPEMSEKAIADVRKLEAVMETLPQKKMEFFHTIHGGMYSRTTMVPAGVMISGALIKIATMLIISGHVVVYVGGTPIELSGYNVLPASPNRKQIFIAKTDTYITMIFPSGASSVEQAEKEFTDEYDRLCSRTCYGNNKTIVTGE